MDQQRAKEFIYRNARPLDLARWNYHFEGGSKEAVLACLAYYQNEDGGFGYGLEADCLNVNSAPLQTWKAAEILWEIGWEDSSHPIIQKMLAYLASGEEFSEELQIWKYQTASNNDYPHAVWWGYTGEPTAYSPNPTASLAGFILLHGDKKSELYKKAQEMAKRAYRYMIENHPIMESHNVTCYIQLYEYCRKAEETGLFDMEDMKNKLIELVSLNICPETEKWGREYVATPMSFIASRASMFYKGNEELVKQECRRLTEQQLADGSFNLTWNWCTDYNEFEIAKNWWKSSILIDSVRFVREFDT